MCMISLYKVCYFEMSCSLGDAPEPHGSPNISVFTSSLPSDACSEHAPAQHGCVCTHLRLNMHKLTQWCTSTPNHCKGKAQQLQKHAPTCNVCVALVSHSGNYAHAPFRSGVFLLCTNALHHMNAWIQQCNYARCKCRCSARKERACSQKRASQ